MNKKYLAVVMAGATVATSVAPIFAVEKTEVIKETTTVKESDALIKEVDNLLSIKYNGDGETVVPVYEITAGDKVINKIEDLKKIINEIPNNSQLVVKIKDKGHVKNDEGKIVSKAVGTYKTYADLSEEAIKIEAENKKEEGKAGLYSIANVSAELKKSTDGKDIMSITLQSKESDFKKIDIKIGDNKINLKANPFDKDGKELEIKGDLDLTQINSFSDADPEDIPSKDIKEVTVKNGELVVVGSSDIYDGYRLSAKGIEISKDNGRVIGDISEKDSETGKYSYIVKYIDALGNPIELKVESLSMSTLEKSRNALTNNDVKVDVLAGENRYSTAIEIAKSSGLNENVVIVNSNKIVDGLAATPFAKAKNAPILLASDKEIPQITLDHIKSIIKTNPNANIYIVGGESAVSKDSEAQLTNITKNVERIAGSDRHTTSLAVAKEIEKGEISSKAYVVGAKAEPDAMSIASKAAETYSPIIVNGWSGLSKESMTMLKDKEIDIIGGESSVSSDIESNLKLVAKDSKVDRVQGENRNDTNAKVIEKYYSDVQTLYIAKDGYGNNNMLIDALAAGPLAAGNGPIILATNKMVDSQQKAITDKVSKDAKVIQIGNGIKTDIYTKIANILGW